MDRNGHYEYITAAEPVALRKESVDRNIALFDFPIVPAVALRKESVDRNNGRLRAVQNTKVALRKESVDRNADLVLNA